MKNWFRKLKKRAPVTSAIIILAIGLAGGIFLEHKYKNIIHKAYFKTKQILLFWHLDREDKPPRLLIGKGILVLCDSETDEGLAVWQRENVPFARSSEHAEEGKYSLKVVYPKEEYPGISSLFRIAKPEDWGGFKFLKFDVYNSQDELVNFCVILKDKTGYDYARRYDAYFNLIPGLNKITVDLTQLKRNDGSGYLEVKSIIQYVFCLNKPEKQTVLYFDNIRLEKSSKNEEFNQDISILIDAENVTGKINPLIFGTNFAPKTTDQVSVVKFTSDIGLTLLRYPGGDAPGYHWKTGTFDYWTQKPFMFAFAKYDNMVAFCQKTGTNLLIQLNLESGTPQEAAEWVEHTNKELGFYVKYWELGNEPYGTWDKSHRTAEQYALNIKEYSDAMKAVDPTIKLGAAWGGAYFGKWDEVVMENAGQYIDFVSYHWYPNHTSRNMKPNGKEHPDPLDIAANAFNVPKIVARMRSIIRQKCSEKQGKIEFGFLEWDGTWDAPSYNPEPYEQGVIDWSLANALFYAETFGQFIKEGVTLSTNFKFQETPFGLIRGHLTENAQDNVSWDGVTIRPKAYAMQLFRRHFGDTLVQTVIKNSPVYYKSQDWYDSSYTGEVPYLSCYASKDEQGDKLYVMLINRHPEASLPIIFQLDGFIPQDEYDVWKLTGPEITSQNDGNPGLVNIVHEKGSLGGAGFKYLCPARSVVSILLYRKSAQ